MYKNCLENHLFTCMLMLFISKINKKILAISIFPFFLAHWLSIEYWFDYLWFFSVSLFTFPLIKSHYRNGLLMAISNSKMVWSSRDTDVIFLSSVLIIRVNGEEVRLMLWDTAGQEEFDAITKAYYRGKGKKTWMQKQIRSLLLFKKRIFVWDIWENLMNTLYEIGTMSKTKLKRNDIMKDHKCVR